MKTIRFQTLGIALLAMGFLGLAAMSARAQGTGASRVVRPAGEAAATPAPIPPIPDTAAKLAADNAAFALDLYRRLATEKQGNLFFSPHSISEALAMTYGGARGATAEQMVKALHFSLGPQAIHPAFAQLEQRLAGLQGQGTVPRIAGRGLVGPDGTVVPPESLPPPYRPGTLILRVANSLWVQKDYPLQDDFKTIVDQDYQSTLTPVDYKTATEAARLQINNWVAERTEKKITEIIPTGILDPLTRLVLVNAVYFYADWQRVFDAQLTANAPFHVDAQRTVQVPMMTQRPTSFPYAEVDGLQVLQLNYVGQQLSMLVLLPGETAGLGALESRLKAEDIERYRGALRRQMVDVHFPKFRMDSDFRLDKTLMALGVTDLFRDGAADLTGIAGRRGELYVKAVLHKAYVSVDEQGTEAAAATAVIGGRGGRGPQAVVFRADHPFLFLIQDNGTGGILFMGRVTDPTAGGK